MRDAGALQAAEKAVLDELLVRVESEQTKYKEYAASVAYADRAKYQFMRPTVARSADVRASERGRREPRARVLKVGALAR